MRNECFSAEVHNGWWQAELPLLTVIYKTQNDYPVGLSPPARTTICVVSRLTGPGQVSCNILGLSYGKMLNVLYSALTRMLISRYEWWPELWCLEQGQAQHCPHPPQNRCSILSILIKTKEKTYQNVSHDPCLPPESVSFTAPNLDI